MDAQIHQDRKCAGLSADHSSDMSGSESASVPGQASAPVQNSGSLQQFIGLTCAPGRGIVDTAAEDGCVGESQLKDLSEHLSGHGLQFVGCGRMVMARCSPHAAEL